MNPLSFVRFKAERIFENLSRYVTDFSLVFESQHTEKDCLPHVPDHNEEKGAS